METIHYDLYMGIDVQVNRGCSYFVFDQDLAYIDSGWVQGEDFDETAALFKALVETLNPDGAKKVAVGIDASRMPLMELRSHHLNNGVWQESVTNKGKRGRHCEVVVKSLGLGNPQWTPLAEDAPQWMALGFAIFWALDKVAHTYETFPSASYKMLEKDKNLQVAIPFAGFRRGPKDMLDACMCAVTVYEFAHGRGCEVGGGDGTGTIVLPRKVDGYDSEALTWPGD